MTYRVLVVAGNGFDSPESLLESAKSSEATDMGGSLLQFEYLDQNVQETRYSILPMGFKPLYLVKLLLAGSDLDEYGFRYE